VPAQEATTDVLGAGAAAKLFDVSKDGVVLRAHVQPGARGEGLVGAHGDALKVRVRAAAVSGKANAAVLGLLARELDVPVSSVRLVAGAARRDKRVAFAGMTGPELGARLAQALLRAAAP
jgi:uncharacterized protein (TIGR00251 family)